MRNLIKNQHGVWCVRRKVPAHLQAAAASVLGTGKAKQVWLKKSTRTKDLREANIIAKPLLINFDKIIAAAEAQTKARPLRTTLTDVEIKRIADYFYANELLADEELREDSRGSDPGFASVHRQLTEAGVKVTTSFDINSLTLEPGRGLSPRMMHKVEEGALMVLGAAQQALARGDVSFIRWELDELLRVFQINLDPSSAAYRRLARAVTEAFVRSLKITLARHNGEPVETPPLLILSEPGVVHGGSLQEAQDGWKKERAPSLGVLNEYNRAIRLFTELHGEIPVAQITRTHARTFREALQALPRHRSDKLRNAPFPELCEWGRQHPEAPKITNATVNKLLGGVQTIAIWAHSKGIIPDDVHWSDPFARMRLPEAPPERDAFTLDELNVLFASPVFTTGKQPKPGRGEAAFWMPLLGLYTGARRGELAALTVRDVYKLDGAFVFSFVEEKGRGKTLKTRSSARTVPVHPQLVKLGLMKHVEAIRRTTDESAWLFPSIAPSEPSALKAWTKWFNRHLRTLGIEDRRKVFHSFRHTFKDALRAARVSEELNDALTGHANASVGRSYGAKEIVRRFGMPALKDAISRVNYRGLKLSGVRSGQ